MRRFIAGCRGNQRANLQEIRMVFSESVNTLAFPLISTSCTGRQIACWRPAQKPCQRISSGLRKGSFCRPFIREFFHRFQAEARNR